MTLVSRQARCNRKVAFRQTSPQLNQCRKLSGQRQWARGDRSAGTVRPHGSRWPRAEANERRPREEHGPGISVRLMGSVEGVAGAAENVTHLVADKLLHHLTS